jgi:hypothetical protein
MHTYPKPLCIHALHTRLQRRTHIYCTHLHEFLQPVHTHICTLCIQTNTHTHTHTHTQDPSDHGLHSVDIKGWQSLPTKYTCAHVLWIPKQACDNSAGHKSRQAGAQVAISGDFPFSAESPPPHLHPAVCVGVCAHVPACVCSTDTLLSGLCWQEEAGSSQVLSFQDLWAWGPTHSAVSWPWSICTCTSKDNRP